MVWSFNMGAMELAWPKHGHNNQLNGGLDCIGRRVGIEGRPMSGQHNN